MHLGTLTVGEKLLDIVLVTCGTLVAALPSLQGDETGHTACASPHERGYYDGGEPDDQRGGQQQQQQQQVVVPLQFALWKLLAWRH